MCLFTFHDNIVALKKCEKQNGLMLPCIIYHCVTFFYDNLLVLKMVDSTEVNETNTHVTGWNDASTFEDIDSYVVATNIFQCKCRYQQCTIQTTIGIEQEKNDAHGCIGSGKTS